MTLRTLLVKISALGDLIHALPAVSDARQAHPHLRLEWLVEEGLAEIPHWHPGVDRVHPVALRHWRRAPLDRVSRSQAAIFLRSLRAERYDVVVDAQGLLKSAILATLARGPVVGPAADWVREKYALPFYGRRIPAPQPHVVERLRHLMATALHYPVPDSPPDFGLDPQRLGPWGEYRPPAPEYLILLHGTAWTSKVWPPQHWSALAREVVTRGVAPLVLLPWGTPAERERAEALARAAGQGVQVLPRLPLGEMARLIARAKGVVGLDSGLAHLAAALGVPCVTLFGATNPGYSGIDGPHQRFVRASFACAPCMLRNCPVASKAADAPPCLAAIPPQRVLATLEELLNTTTPGESRS